MSTRELKQKYGKNKTTKAAYNAAIRAECSGGNELLDLLELVNHMKKRARSRDERSKLDTIDDRLQVIRDRMVCFIREQYGFEDND